ncbi:HAMP domain-containing histidine kinase [Yimella sp. RIT 621]|uniref:Sensor histidine kinase MtrB n=1 Tax=Yimella lutea TaxID=587872 RepID=A0A542EJD7_9MICO|nr:MULTISPECIES: MtrAB system histidine kinase MtrB [Yimella]RYG76930.1 HAMP domain-containing histidine kinase [Yimella sp. RIT 621]TQJ15450.1 two-component system sensor histidine kinase MtrB [Yimella lutea]
MPDLGEPHAQQSAARRWFAALGAALLATARSVRHSWRRSLHTRVVTTTALAGAIVTLVLGSYMYHRIATDLVESRTSSAEAESQSRRADAQEIFASTPNTDLSSLRQLASDMVQQVSSPGDDLSRRVVFMQAADNTAQPIPKVSSAQASPEMIPEAIRTALKDDPDHQQVQIITVPQPDGDSVPAVLIGSRVSVPNAGPYDLFFIFPMDDEVTTLNIVKGSFAAGGVALLALLAALAYLVTRMVVTPVRSAAHVAERLTAGALNERMQVSGEDDLARLATSFNAMADSLQRQIRQLEDLSSLQQRFTSDVSHELRTPLTTIRMAVDMIHAHRADFSQPLSRSAELLSAELDRFEALLSDLLEISRFDAGAAALTLGPGDMRDLVDRVVDSVQILAERNGTEITVLGKRGVVVPMDHRRIERILRNLVTNAIEHGERKPIEIDIGSNSGAVAVTVRDHGVGLEPGDAVRVFNRFWRADPARARTTGGTGLGLSISLEDARLHEGWLQAWGSPGEGSCFRLTLPRRPGQPIGRSPLPLAPDDSQVGRVMPAGNSLTLGTNSGSQT